MMFDWNGLQDQRYFILKQKPDPLKYCNYALPFPMPIGLPFMPCDLPNQYQLYETNQTYQQTGALYLSFQQQIGLLQRILIPASHRPWKMTGKDYYNYTPYLSFRNLNICLSSNDRPEIKVFMHNKYIGRIRQTTILNCCCIVEKFQQFQVYDDHDHLIYRIVSRNPQRGHFIILPFCNFNNIKYQILQIQYRSQQSQILNQSQQQVQIIQQKLVGQIVHLFNGFSQYTSKNDKYGITLPQDSNQQQKCLLIHAVLIIDYLLFQNF